MTNHTHPLTDLIHPDNWATHSWALLHCGTVVTQIHFDSDGFNFAGTCVTGLKIWGLVKPKHQLDLKDHQRIAVEFKKIAQSIVSFCNRVTIKLYWMESCDIQVVYLHPGGWL